MSPQAPRDVRVWLSAGAGPSTFRHSEGGSLRASATVSVGRAALLGRQSLNFEGIDGHVSIDESAVLAGWRFGGKHLFVIPAVGVANAHWLDDLCTAHITCTPEATAELESKGPGVAFDLGFHASKLIAGLALNISGIAAPEKRRYLATVISIELGFFGR
ncbi:MAG TPA: hypothetical protein VFO55_04815 [Gemmatimonadaceae bacterium]|nr:hypothetical protein [Gemmatimonadaceae bacterium]